MQWLYAECSTTASDEAGQERRERRAWRARSSSDRPSHRRRSPSQPPCMIAVPKPRTIHVPTPASGTSVLVVEVLDDREAGADGKAEDRRIDEEADAVRADQRDDDERLAELLDDGPDVAAVSA